MSENPVTQGPKTMLKGFSGNIADVDATGHLFVTSGGAAATSDQGAPNTLDNAWPIKIVSPDGFFVLGDVVDPVRTDPTGVTIQPVSGTVGISSGTITNITNPLPSGSNVIGHVIVDSGTITAVTTVTTVTNPGAKTNNAAVPGATNVGTLPAVATTAAPAYTNTFQAALSVDLAGNLRSQLVSVAGTTLGTPTNFGTTPGAVIAISSNSAQFIGTVAAIAGAGNVTTGVQRVTLATDQAAFTTPMPCNNTQVNGVAILAGAGNTGTGSLRVTIATDQAAFTTPMPTSSKPSTTGGCTMHSSSTQGVATVIKGSAGQLYGCEIYNGNVAACYIQIFNVAAASVTLGTTVPVRSIGILPGGTLTRDWSNGLAFATAMSYGATTTRLGAGAPANAVDVNFDFA